MNWKFNGTHVYALRTVVPMGECSAGKGLDSQLCHYRELQTREQAGSSLPVGFWERVTSIPRRTTYHRTVDSMATPV